MKINHYHSKIQSGKGKTFRRRATALCAAALLALSPLSTAAEAANILADNPTMDYDLCVFGGGGGGGGYGDVSGAGGGGGGGGGYIKLADGTVEFGSGGKGGKGSQNGSLASGAGGVAGGGGGGFIFYDGDTYIKFPGGSGGNAGAYTGGSGRDSAADPGGGNDITINSTPRVIAGGDGMAGGEYGSVGGAGGAGGSATYDASSLVLTKGLWVASGEKGTNGEHGYLFDPDITGGTGGAGGNATLTLSDLTVNGGTMRFDEPADGGTLTVDIDKLTVGGTVAMTLSGINYNELGIETLEFNGGTLNVGTANLDNQTINVTSSTGGAIIIGTLSGTVTVGTLPGGCSIEAHDSNGLISGRSAGTGETLDLSGATKLVMEAPPKTTITITGLTKDDATYDGSAKDGYTGTADTGAYTGSLEYTYYSGTGTDGTNLGSTAPTNAGTYTVVAAIPDTDTTYSGSHTPITFTITRKSVTVTNDDTLTVSKPYDGTANAGTATGTLALDGVVPADTANVLVKIDEVGVYKDANVGKNKTITLTISLEGSASCNYALGSTSYSFTKAEITKVAYNGTTASAPDSTPDSKSDKSITLAPVTPPNGENVEYAMSRTNTAPTLDSDWQDSPTFDNLDPNTEYFFFARVKENGNHAAGGTSSATSITTDKSEYTTKPTKPDGTPDSKSDTSITLKTVTPPDGETLQYGIEKPDGTIGWQDSPAFSPLSPNTEYKFYTRVKENDKHKAGSESDATTIKTDLSDAQKVAAAKTEVTKALDNFTATNATDAEAVMAAVNKALTDAGITGVTLSWDTSGAFTKTDADEDNAGSVTGKIKLTCGSESDTVTLNKTIAQLPSDPEEKVRTVKAAIEAALKAYTATNETTAADIKAIVDKANTDSGVTGVTVEWKTPSDFNNMNSTNSENGKVTGTFDLSCTKGGSTATDTVSVNCPIERSDDQKLADAKTKAEAALAAMTATNDTTAEDVMTAVNNALSGTGVTAAWKTPSDFNKTLATESGAGSITGTIEFSLNSKKSETNANLPIARLVADKAALTNAIADANNAKIGISVDNNAPSSVSNGTKFVSDGEMKALTDAIAAAQTVADNATATTAEVTAAANALKTAVDTFKAAIKTGTYTSSGGSGGGSSSGGNIPVVVPPMTPQTNPPTTVETKVPATVDNNGNATVNVTDKTMQDAIDKAVAEAKKNGTGGNGIAVVIRVAQGENDADTITVNLPKTVQEKAMAGKVLNTVVVVERPDIAINMNLASITEINKQAKADVQLSATRMDNTKLSSEAKAVIGNRPTFDLKASYDNGKNPITNFGDGMVNISIPYVLASGEEASNVRGIYVDKNGKVNYIKESVYNKATKQLQIDTNHFSVYGVGYLEEEAEKISVQSLQLQAKGEKNHNVLTWKPVKNADGYIVYGAACGSEKLKELKVITKKGITRYQHTKLKAGTYYKYQVKAYQIKENEKEIQSKSKLIHSVTAGSKKGNPVKVTITPSTLTLSKNKKKQISGKVIGESKKEIKQHTNILRYESSDSSIATVSSTGVVTAKEEGFCYIYVYAQNGISKKVLLTVE